MEPLLHEAAAEVAVALATDVAATEVVAVAATPEAAVADATVIAKVAEAVDATEVTARADTGMGQFDLFLLCNK